MSSRLVAKADTLNFFVIITKDLVIKLKHDTLPRKIRGMTQQRWTGLDLRSWAQLQLVGQVTDTIGPPCLPLKSDGAFMIYLSVRIWDTSISSSKGQGK